MRSNIPPELPLVENNAWFLWERFSGSVFKKDSVAVHNNGALRIERHQGYRLGVNVLSVKFCLQGLRNGRAIRCYD